VPRGAASIWHRESSRWIPVALGSVGETVHKLTLRISGAIIGGLIAGLSIVFILPHFDDIGQLCLLTAVVAAFAGWVTTSSERLSYAGMQIALAFFMGILQTYSPVTDLTVQRETAWSVSSWAMS
jgi:multidrug resistance protein MdtO